MTLILGYEARKITENDNHRHRRNGNRSDYRREYRVEGSYQSTPGKVR